MQWRRSRESMGGQDPPNPSGKNLIAGKTMTQGYRDDIKATVLHLKDLVEYQEGSIASRMVVNKKAGSITIFAFDENEGLPEHSAPFDAVVTVLDGACEVRISGIAYPMKEGDTIIFPANEPHAVSAKTRFKMILTMIKE